MLGLRHGFKLKFGRSGFQYQTFLTTACSEMYRGDRRGNYRGRGYRSRGGYQPDYGDAWHEQSYRGYSDQRRSDYRDSNQDHRLNEENDRQRFSGPKGKRRPRHLRGKAIGLWYAAKSKAKAEQQEKDQQPEVKMVKHQERNIRKLLHDIKSSRECPPQPSRSGAPLPPEDTFEESLHKYAPVSDRREDIDWFEDNQKIKEPDWFEVNQKNREPEGATGQDFGALKIDPGASSINSEALDSKDEVFSTMQESNTLENEGDGQPIQAFSEMMQLKAEEDYMFEEESQVVPPDVKYSDTISLDLMYEHQMKQENKLYQKMQTFRQKLPSYAYRQKIIELIDSNQVVVLSGETGCGKTTQVPQYILDDFLENREGSNCRIICTQPRRISAISVAERVAAERAEECGQSVGYTIRLENKLPRNYGSILYCTTGILLTNLDEQSLVHSATHIILDEVHERDLNSDFLMVILKDILPKRPDLKVILMSATINAQQFSEYFNNCPMISIPGLTYPVKEYLLEDVIEQLQYRVPEDMMKKKPRGGLNLMKVKEEEEKLSMWLDDLQEKNRYHPETLEALWVMDTSRIDRELVSDLIKYIVTHKGEGAILVFLPGLKEIKYIHKKLWDDTFFCSSSYLIIALHSMMPTVNQREVFETPPPGVRKIVLATNIAETSITIEDVVYVIDGGLIKVNRYSPETNLTTLSAEMVSQANARQRRGRAGRVQPGECYHLYTSLQQTTMENYLPPEILRTRLEELCLQIKFHKLGKIMPFIAKAMQPPPLVAVQVAIDNLKNLNALDEDENLLPLGKHLARMPLDPHIGKMLLFGALFGCLDPISTICASLSFKNPFVIPVGMEAEVDKAKLKMSDGSCSDHILLVKAYNSWVRAKQRGTNKQLCHEYFMAESTLLMLQKMRQQLVQVLEELQFIPTDSRQHSTANRNSDNSALVKAVVCAGLYPNIAKIRKITKHGTITFQTSASNDLTAAQNHPGSVVGNIREAPTQWVVFHKKMKTRKVWLYDISLVSAYSLLFFGRNIKQDKENGDNIVIIDDWIKFKASQKTVKLVEELRKELDSLLESKVNMHNVKDCNPEPNELAMLDVITDLVTTESDKPFSTGRWK